MKKITFSQQHNSKSETPKSNYTKHALALFVVAFTAFFLAQNNVLYGQNKKSIAIISMDAEGLSMDAKTITSMVQLELEKANVYEVLDKYDVSDLVKQQNIDVKASFGKNSLVRVGKLLKADKMLSGSIEKFGNKLIVILRLVDVEKDIIEKTDVMEYINQQDQLQTMIRLSVNNILGIQNDRMIVELLVDYDQPITSSKTTLKLSGPRVGANLMLGENGKRLQDPTSKGGFDMFPVSSMIGYQFEKQYLSAGDFQALVELIPSINALESGKVIPSLTGLLGFRFNKSGLEFGLGPNIRMVKMADGHFDGDGNWILGEDPDFRYETLRQLDSRGDIDISSGMIFALGKTFRSGYLNLPVNVYVSPRKSGSIIGITVGFNVANRPKLM